MADNSCLMYFINKLFDIDLDKYDSDNKFIRERRFEVILTSFELENEVKMTSKRRSLINLLSLS